MRKRKPYLYDQMTEEMRKAIKIGWITMLVSIAAIVVSISAALYIATKTITV